MSLKQGFLWISVYNFGQHDTDKTTEWIMRRVKSSTERTDVPFFFFLVRPRTQKFILIIIPTAVH